jgi:hypothetical protein
VGVSEAAEAEPAMVERELLKPMPVAQLRAAGEPPFQFVTVSSVELPMP